MIDVSKWFITSVKVNNDFMSMVENIAVCNDSESGCELDAFCFRITSISGLRLQSIFYKTKNDAENAMNEFIKKIEE